MSKIDDDESVDEPHGHITSLAVQREYRKLGIANMLMSTVQKVMLDCYDVRYVSLHVRVGNKAALNLYQKTLSFEVHETELKYYADGEDAYDMRKYLRPAHAPQVKQCGSGCSHDHHGHKKRIGRK